MSGTNLKIRSDNWRSVEVELAATKLAGAMDKIQELVGVYMEGGDSGDDVAFCYDCEKIVVPKNVATADVFVKGDKVYYNNTDKKVSGTSGGNTLCGRALEDASRTTTEVLIDLKGNIVA